MAKLFNLARVTTPTTGTGTIALGPAVSGYLAFSTAGVVDGDVVVYGIKDGANSEVGFGTYTAAGTTLTRNVTSSTNANAAISLSGSAEVFITARAQDFLTQPLKPGGRLTLTSGTPVMSANVSAATTVYYTPYEGNYVPLYDGSSFVPTEFAELSQATTDATKSPAACVQDGNYDLFVWNDAGTLRCTRGPIWARSSTITVTIASPAVVTWNGHGLTEAQPIVFTNSGGALPTGITAGTVYYVARAPAANTFSISTSIANAMNNTRVNTSGSQSGTHTGTARSAISRGTGAGTSELTLTKGIYLNTNAITNGPAALRGTYVGTIHTDASSQINHIIFAAASGGGVVRADVFNAYNRVLQIFENQDNGASYSYNSNVLRAARGSATNRIWFCLGLIREVIEAWEYGDVAVDAASTAPSGFGPVFDDTTGASDMLFSSYSPGSLLVGFGFDSMNPPILGEHFCGMQEFADATSTDFRVDNDTILKVFIWS
jgi:hypothetical protein